MEEETVATDLAANRGGYLEVGVMDDGMIVVNLTPEVEGIGHVVFSPDQAKDFAWKLLRQAVIAAQDINQDFEEPTPTPGTVLIMQERERQIHEEGWTAEHDAEYPEGRLAQAGACYALKLANREMPLIWPFPPAWWKPSEDPVRNMVKAGALIAAEIDRMQAAAIAG